MIIFVLPNHVVLHFERYLFDESIESDCGFPDFASENKTWWVRKTETTIDLWRCGDPALFVSLEIN